MLNVLDAVSANIFCMNKKEAFNGAVYDVGTGNNISLDEVREIINLHFPNLKFNYVQPRAGDVLLTKANIEPLSCIGWKTKIDIKTGINECFENLKRSYNE